MDLEELGLELDAQEWDCLRRIFSEPVVAHAALARELADYRASLPELSRVNPMMDVELATAIGHSCERLMTAHTEDAPLPQRALIQAAVRYYIEDEDAAGDLESFMGFDDDADVVNAVANWLGHPEWGVAF